MTGLRARLSNAHPAVFTLFAGLAGFSAYFSMYAFRKPFSAATFENVDGWTFLLDYKVALVIAQVAGYALSKLIGVKVVSEIGSGRRGLAILALIGVAWLALLIFPLVPAPWNVAALFLNGLPLGMIWGLVFGYMEGRRVSEALGAILCASFIVSSGLVKSVGKWLMQVQHVDVFWMPAVTGALFIPLLLLSVWALEQMPPPSAEDEAERVRRAPMTGPERLAFLRTFAPGILMLVIGYVLLSAFRDFRDNFAAEIWKALGFGEASSVFSASELPVAVVALGVLAALMTVKDNLKALLAMHGVIMAGCALVGLSTLAFQAHLISPLAWMILNGAGLYMGYTPFNAMLFDRLVAYSGQIATAAFLIYVADAAGYFGTVGLLFWRNFGAPELDWLQAFSLGAYAVSVIGVVFTGLSMVYFLRRAQRQKL